MKDMNPQEEMTNNAIPEIEITRCLPESEDKAKSFSQIYRIFEDTATDPRASKTAFRSRLRNLCQHGVIHQTEKGLFYQDAYKSESTATPTPATRTETPTKQAPETIAAESPGAIRRRLKAEACRRQALANIAEARALMHEALVLMDKAD